MQIKEVLNHEMKVLRDSGVQERHGTAPCATGGAREGLIEKLQRLEIFSN